MAQLKFYNGYHVTTPTVTPTAVFSGTGGLLGNGNYQYAYSFVTVSGETNVSTASIAASPGTTTGSAVISNIATSGDIYVIARKLYRTTVGGALSTLKLVTTINDNYTTSYTDGAADSSLGASPVVLSTADPIYGTLGNSLFSGLISATANAETGANAGSAITCHGNFIKLTYTSVTVAANAGASSTITNNYVSADSIIHATINSYSGTLGAGGLPVVIIKSITDGSFVLSIMNPGLSALNGTLIVSCTIIN